MWYILNTTCQGPAGLAAAIRLKQIALEKGEEIEVCVVEKGSEVGAHILSGNVFETKALDELLPNWREMGAPLDTPAGDDEFLILTETGNINDIVFKCKARSLYYYLLEM